MSQRDVCSFLAPRCRLAVAAALCLAQRATAVAQTSDFVIAASAHGITSLKRLHDSYDTEYLAADAVLGAVDLRYKRSAAKHWSDLSFDCSGATGESSSGNDLVCESSFRVAPAALIWTITIRNLAPARVEIGDLAVPLPFNSRYSWNKTDTYTHRLIRHSFVGEDGSFVFWMRTNGIGPFLVMTPRPGTSLE
ncbi:MAG TPA: DUF5695 domain-containing protein, partial [Chthonomonadales bacterium]|nr:DUF5695 domain-containing protein [Chthonomonadales bacterium]